MKIVKTFQLKIVIFTAVKERCMLHGHVFVMNGETVLLELYDNTPMQYTANLNGYQKLNFIVFLIFAQNIDYGYTLEVLMSTHNLCFRVKMIGKKLYPCKPQSGIIKGGLHYTYISA